MSKVATFEFNTDQTSKEINKKLSSFGFDCQVVEISTRAKKKKRKRFHKPSLMNNQKRYILYLSEYNYFGKEDSYLSMIVQVAKHLLKIINDEGIYYYRNDIGEEFDEQNTKYIRAEGISSYPPDMNEPYPTRYFISRIGV